MQFFCFHLIVFCFCVTLLYCGSYTRSKAIQTETTYIIKEKPQLFGSVPSNSSVEGSHFVSTEEGYYFAGKHALWEKKSNANEWKVIYNYKPFSVGDRDLNIIKKFIVTPTQIWLVFAEFLIRSEDGGQTWSKVKLPIELITDFSVSNNSKTVYLTGRVLDDIKTPKPQGNNLRLSCPFITGNGKFKEYIANFVSYNNGTDWETFSYPCDVGSIEKIVHVSENVNYYVSPNAFLKKDRNDWQVEGFKDLLCEGTSVYTFRELAEMIGKDFPGDAISDACFLDDQTGWMSLSTGDLLYTGNGGNDWCKKNNPSKIWINNTGYDKGYFKRIAFADAANGVALDNDDTLFVTNDSGQSWKIVPFDFPVESFSLYGGKCWFISNRGIYQFGLSTVRK